MLSSDLIAGREKADGGMRIWGGDIGDDETRERRHAGDIERVWLNKKRNSRLSRFCSELGKTNAKE